jgi:hypothetical protein
MLGRVEAERAESPSQRARRRSGGPASARGSVLCLGLCLVLVLAACAGEREGGFDSPVPGARLEAIEMAAQDFRKTGRVPERPIREELVECLHADDPLVRFMAIGTLEDMAGDAKGYRHDDPEALRRLAIPAWAAWAVSPDAPATSAPPSAAAAPAAPSEQTVQP